MQSEALKNIVRATVPRELRNWLRSPSRSLKWLWDSTRFSLGKTQTLELVPGLTIVCHPAAYTIFRNAQIDDPEQSEEFKNFLSYCSDKMVLFDVGAHWGVFTLAAALKGAAVVAMDPSPTAAHMIEIQSAINKCKDKIRVLKSAASDVSGSINMLSSGVFTAGYFRVASGRMTKELTTIRSVTIDEISERFGPPTHIKIDVEGHEIAALRGARITLKNNCPLLFLELHNEMIAADGGNPEETLDLLRNHGYKTIALGGNKISRDEILEKPIIRVIARREPD
jgi:FkbM family methyltransferase